MGQSTDAILFYGFHSGEGDWDEFIGEDWEVTFAGKMGTPAPTVEYDTTEHKALHSAFWDAQAALVAAEPCEVDTHCSDGCRMPFVCVKASNTRASRGAPKEIKSLVVGVEWDAQLRAFCARMGIPWQEPRWWLASDWT